MIDFGYFRPHSLAEALDFLDKHGDTWRVIAGGTDLLLTLRDLHGTDPELEGVVDITGLKDLRGVRVSGTDVTLGALTTFTDLLRSELILKEAPILAEMAAHMGSIQIRNRATVGGNLINASPCADSAPPLFALAAEVELTSVGETRRIPLEEFSLGPGKTKIRPSEIMTRLHFPRIEGTTRCAYFKLGRRNSAAISRMTVAVIRTDDGTNGDACRLALGAVTPTPLRLRKVEERLAEEGWNAGSIERAASTAREEVEKITGVRWSSMYKLPVLENLVRRTLEGVL